MGNTDSTISSEGENKVQSTLSSLQHATEKNGDEGLREYIQAWDSIKAPAGKGATYPYEELIRAHAHDIFEVIRFAYHHNDPAWRQEGIKRARKFFSFDKARENFRKADFIDAVLLSTLSDAAVDDEGKSDETEHEQVEAAKTISEMADYDDFHPCLCDTAVLNFLCIVLNQVQSGREIVTGTFVKLAREANLVLLVEAAVGDILQSCFKTTNFRKPSDEEPDKLAQWNEDIPALSHCAFTLGKLIRHGHGCMVEKRIIIEVFDYALDTSGEEQRPDMLGLLTRMSQLFYWILRQSKDLSETLCEAAPKGKDLDYVLKVLQVVWSTSVKTYEMIKCEKKRVSLGPSPEFEQFCVDDLDRTKPLCNGSPHLEADEVKKKIACAEARLCFMNCILCVLLPVPDIRWKIRQNEFQKLHLAFELPDEDSMLIILGTVRHLLDLPAAQECHELIEFFGNQLLILLNAVSQQQRTYQASSNCYMIPDSCTVLLMDSLTLLAMQRGMQCLLAERQIWKKASPMLTSHADSEREDDRKKVQDKKRVQLSVIRILLEVALHPSHRLGWVAKPGTQPMEYPPREEFEKQLQDSVRDGDDNFKTIASLLLTLFHEEKFHKSCEKFEMTFKSIFLWWHVNSTACYDELHEASTKTEEKNITQIPIDTSSIRPLNQYIRPGRKRVLTCMEAMSCCAPHECVLALTLFSRLALEPRFKRLFDENKLEGLLRCVSVGIWAEAREAAATLANLMWLPDLEEERLVCWLKFDGPQCIAVDASNVLLPAQVGQPKPVAIGRGMYRSRWGIEFTAGTAVLLHPDGLTTDQVPCTLTSASPMDTFENTSRKPYVCFPNEECEGEPFHHRHFTINCWFYWPVSVPKQDRVLVHSKKNRMSQIYLDVENHRDTDGKWTVTDENGKARPVPFSKIPKLNCGWHMLTLVSSTSENMDNPFNGTKFFLDSVCCCMEDVWVSNDFYIVGNDSGPGGKRPFGIIADFRIYARSLPDETIKRMVKGTEPFPDHIVQRLARMNAATVLAQRLDVPDSAVECLRALGSLATHSEQRAKIFGVCGHSVLRLLDSPLPMIQRQAARLLANLS